MAIALFTVTFSHLHYNVFEHGCEAISGNFALLARNCLTSTFKNIVMQMRKVNCEKGYSVPLLHATETGLRYSSLYATLITYCKCTDFVARENHR